MSTAKAIHQRMQQTGRTRMPGSILTIVSDDHTVHCLAEEHLDTWWASLDPEEKAEIYEQSLNACCVLTTTPQLDAELRPQLLQEAERMRGVFSALAVLDLDRLGRPLPHSHASSTQQSRRTT